MMWQTRLWKMGLMLAMVCVLMMRTAVAQDNRAYNEALRRIEVAKADRATELDLRQLELTALPPEIGQLTGLQKLYLNGNP